MFLSIFQMFDSSLHMAHRLFYIVVYPVNYRPLLYDQFTHLFVHLGKVVDWPD